MYLSLVTLPRTVLRRTGRVFLNERRCVFNLGPVYQSTTRMGCVPGRGQKDIRYSPRPARLTLPRTCLALVCRRFLQPLYSRREMGEPSRQSGYHAVPVSRNGFDLLLALEGLGRNATE